jgi:low affinity Fe/Cu permease
VLYLQLAACGLRLAACSRIFCFSDEKQCTFAVQAPASYITECALVNHTLCRGGGGGGGQAARDILGVDVKLDAWIKTHPSPGSRELAQGLKVSVCFRVESN